VSEVSAEERGTTDADVPPEPSSTPGMTGLRVTAIAVIVIGAIALWQSLAVHEGGGYSAIGPGLLPVTVSIALLVLGVAFLLTATLWPDAYLVRKVAGEHAATHWQTPVLLCVLLLVYAFALGPIGYILATALFLPVASRVLGSTALVRDVVVGVLLTLVLYFGFTRALGVRLPDGILAPVLDLIG
jgi:putative tricarboxylic transport membrane protein